MTPRTLSKLSFKFNTSQIFNLLYSDHIPVTNICGVWAGVNSWKNYLQVSLNKRNMLHAVYLRIYWSGPRKETVLLMVLTLCLMWALTLFPWNTYLRFETISLRSVQPQETVSYNLLSLVTTRKRAFSQVLYWNYHI